MELEKINFALIYFYDRLFNKNQILKQKTEASRMIHVELYLC